MSVGRRRAACCTSGAGVGPRPPPPIAPPPRAPPLTRSLPPFLAHTQELALDAVRTITVELDAPAAPGAPPREIDIKKWAKVEKIPGGSIEDSRVLAGVMFEKDVVVPARMRRCVCVGVCVCVLRCFGVGVGVWVFWSVWDVFVYV
jgi:hypothetical protein